MWPATVGEGQCYRYMAQRCHWRGQVMTAEELSRSSHLPPSDWATVLGLWRIDTTDNVRQCSALYCTEICFGVAYYWISMWRAWSWKRKKPTLSVRFVLMVGGSIDSLFMKNTPDWAWKAGIRERLHGSRQGVLSSMVCLPHCLFSQQLYSKMGRCLITKWAPGENRHSWCCMQSFNCRCELWKPPSFPTFVGP